jgi:DNA-binding LacI/PurR family transcriptional regulator
VCFDQPDTFYSPAAFHFTHIDQQQALMGRSALQMVLDQIATPGSIRKLSLPAELVTGQSTDAPPLGARVYPDSTVSGTLQ